MGNKLFREVLDRLGEYDDSMSRLDVLDRMEKLELIDSADAWMDYRNLRNTLTHEYPDNKEVVIQSIKAAVQVLVSMERCLQPIASYLDTRGLLRRIKCHLRLPVNAAVSSFVVRTVAAL